MNYRTPVVYDYPWDNPITKVACAVGVGWLAYIAISRSKRDERLPERRKKRQALTANSIDLQIDARNRAFGGKVPANPDVPWYSRHNFNRRRRK